MQTLADGIIRALEGQVGVLEVPLGSNTGPQVRVFQGSTYLAGTGWPWCGATYCWALQEAGVPREVAQHIASPSVARMCEVAREEGLVCSPRPGAAIAWCGIHVETLVLPLGGDVWRCIGGNTGDGVRWTTRSVAGALVFGPPDLEDATAALVAQPLYWLEDLKAEYEVKGSWAKRAYAENALEQLRPETRAVAKIVEPGAGGYALRIGEPRHYGPWIGEQGKRNRDKPGGARERLEERRGRRLRPYRTERMPRAPQRAGGRAEALGKTT